MSQALMVLVQGYYPQDIQHREELGELDKAKKIIQAVLDANNIPLSQVDILLQSLGHDYKDPGDEQVLKDVVWYEQQKVSAAAASGAGKVAHQQLREAIQLEKQSVHGKSSNN
ncbi:hypothetical protein GLOTRDRAFT_130525 [Gloeophyllum trabeum ATCC 11539]|uniref:Uncharacterized protein n=1 Tax=Gloeophyllum trabeum (strain ATCC 11539 / FP-39264 / Madison 617) TaxID=670483 RepID=S7Q299_GLOTA|nr:uncharacterized protein GLOTRDRAFT_130525 [Gloeophyllum trabeum ATCC 11539]EPQ54141.1 hypothetical protein GLOTRDRAFT_130525 [Gloeophyllum trabeum ATCC 11539]